jgi:hypothetical protein
MAAFRCLDCAVDTSGRTGIAEYYVVTDEIWMAANPDRAGMLCIGCLEKRIRRRLTPADFIDCPLNTDSGPLRFSKSKRLLNRLGRAA